MTMTCPLAKSIYFAVKINERIPAPVWFFLSRFTNEKANRHYSNSVCLCPYLYFIDSHNINWIWITVHAFALLTSPIVWPIGFWSFLHIWEEWEGDWENLCDRIDHQRCSTCLHNRIGRFPSWFEWNDVKIANYTFPPIRSQESKLRLLRRHLSAVSISFYLYIFLSSLSS